MGLMTYIHGYSLIISLILMPFLVRDRIPALWILYLLLCGGLTPIIGYPLYLIIKSKL